MTPPQRWTNSSSGTFIFVWNSRRKSKKGISTTPSISAVRSYSAQVDPDSNKAVVPPGINAERGRRLKHHPSLYKAWFVANPLPQVAAEGVFYPLIDGFVLPPIPVLERSDTHSRSGIKDIAVPCL